MRDIILVASFILGVAATDNTNNVRATTSYSLTACGEDGVVRINCDSGQIINILSANYGRTRLDVCTIDPRINLNCRAANSLSIVSRQCNGKQSCAVPASASVFGDPCVGTTKYLSVTYECNAKEDTRVQTCSGSSLTLLCPPGQVIEITYSNWGNTNEAAICGGSTTNNVCQSDNSAAVKSLCQWRNSCTLQASSAVFGDPCPSIAKYLDVQYRCVNRTVICGDLTGTLRCPTNTKIQIVEAAFGRQDTTTCPLPFFSGTIGCNSTLSFSKTNDACTGKGSCLLFASTLVYGEPCFGTYKYLQTYWYCRLVY